jgi:hypothetical protein
MATRTNAARRDDSGLRAFPLSVPRTRTPAAPPGVVAQVRIALRPKNRLAAALGAALGAFVPVAGYWLAHHELDLAAPLYGQLTAWLVLGGLLYSCTSVYSWGRVAFGSATKAFGFCVLLEGVLVAAHTSWLSIAALVYLAAINAVVAGTRLALEHTAQ